MLWVAVPELLPWCQYYLFPSMQDFDLCLSCYKEVQHPHQMDMLGLGLELDAQAADEASIKDPKEQRKASIEKCIRFLVHATQCHNTHCKQPSCIKMKRVLTHTRDCKLMLTGKWNQCNVCKQFVLLCISHAKSCNVDKCPVPVCARIKKNLRDQRNQRRVQADRFMQQRVAQMNSALNVPTATAAATPQVGVASPAPPNTSPGNPTSINSPSTKAKGSPAAAHPSNPASNKPYHSAPSPAAGPLSVGKGGPRTPTGKAGAVMANSPVVHPHMSPAPAKSDPLQSLPADGELTIRRVGTGTNDMRRPVPPGGPNQMMMHGNMGPPHMAGGPMYGGHMGQGGGMSQMQPAANPMMRVPQQQQAPPQGFSHAQAQQMLNMRVQQQQRQFVGSAQQYPNPMQGRMMGPGGSPFPASQHPRLEQILTASPQHHPQFNRTYMPGAAEAHHPQYNQQSNYMTGPHPSLGPPPQYGAVNRVQPAGYSQMGPGGPRPGGGMGAPGMQMGANVGAGGYMYNANNNNNNSSSSSSNFVNLGDPAAGFNSLPPQDKLSRFVEHL